MKEIKYVTNILHLTLIGSQSLKNIDINVYDHITKQNWKKMKWIHWFKYSYNFYIYIYIYIQREKGK